MIIQRLLSDLEEAEEMFSKNLQSHSQIILKLTTIHEERLKFWSEFYNHEKEILLKRFHEDISKDKANFEASKCDLECFYFALDEEIKTDVAKTRNKAQNRVDGFRNMVSPFKTQLSGCPSHHNWCVRVLPNTEEVGWRTGIFLGDAHCPILGCRSTLGSS